MSVFVLVHGAFHGAWCWGRVVPRLEAAGHRVVAHDLPSHGDDPTPVNTVTLERYVEAVCGWLDAEPEPVVLAGHSMGGGVITQAAERRPERIGLLVYLCAHLPGDGQSMADMRAQDSEHPVVKHQIFSADGLSMTIRDEAIADIFYGHCTAEDVAWARSRLTPQAVAPFTAPVRTNAARFGRVPRAYLATTQDRALRPALQERMYTALPCQEVVTLDSDHSPFLSQPEILADHLDALARRDYAAATP